MPSVTLEGCVSLNHHLGLPTKLDKMYSKCMYSRGLSQAYEMQDFAHAAAMALREVLTKDGKVQPLSKDDASTFGTLGKVWKDAQEQIRVHKGKPLPGSLTHEKVKRERVQRSLSASVLDSLPSASDASSDAEAQAGDASIHMDNVLCTCPKCRATQA